MRLLQRIDCKSRCISITSLVQRRVVSSLPFAQFSKAPSPVFLLTRLNCIKESGSLLRRENSRESAGCPKLSDAIYKRFRILVVNQIATQCLQIGSNLER